VGYYPVFLDLGAEPCVVVGGGEVAERKVASLLEAGARVTVVSPELTPALAALAETHEILHHPRCYRRGDLAGAVLAYAATADEALHEEIAIEAAEARVLLNVVDRPRLCTFIVPSVLRRGPVAVAISTGGASPALARRLRQDLEPAVGPEYAVAAAILGRVRVRVAASAGEESERARLFRSLVDALLEALRARDAGAVDAILTGLAGEGTTLAALGISLGEPLAPDTGDGP